MADFKTHWRVGLVTSSLSALGLSLYELAPARHIPLLLAIGWTGSIIPDIDSDTSRPRRIIFAGLALFLPSILIYRVEQLHTPLRVVTFWVASAVLILSPLKWVFGKMTRHRGVYHSIPAALIYGGGCAVIALRESASPSLQLSISICGALGFLTHLILDELWAVDFNGRKLPRAKRSFGTALSLGSRYPRANLALYLTLLLTARIWWAKLNQIPVIPEELNIIITAWWGVLRSIFLGEI